MKNKFKKHSKNINIKNFILLRNLKKFYNNYNKIEYILYNIRYKILKINCNSNIIIVDLLYKKVRLVFFIDMRFEKISIIFEVLFKKNFSFINTAHDKINQEILFNILLNKKNIKLKNKILELIFKNRKTYINCYNYKENKLYSLFSEREKLFFNLIGG